MRKKMDFDLEARKKLKVGIDNLAKAVVITLGPQGRVVIFEKEDGSVQVSKDGVTVAKEVALDDPIENIGAKMLREVAIKTSEAAGDGTTTATLLAQAIVDIGMKRVEAGINPMDLKKGLNKAVEAVVRDLQKIAVPVGEDHSKIAQVATISANNDEEIGHLIASAMDKAGLQGVITIEEAKGIETTVEKVEGMQLDRGYLSPYFITNTEKMEVEFENPYILIYDQKIGSMKEVLPLLEKVSQNDAPLLIVAEAIEGEALAVLVVNKIRGIIKVAAIKAPGFGTRRKEILEDIAVLTNGQVISEERGAKLENAELEQLGRCDKIIINKDHTTIINGHGKRETIDAQLKSIQLQMEHTTSEYDREKLEERLAKLAGGVVVIFVGAPTEVELNEKKDRVDDALNATRAAVEEGIVPGGGVAYLRTQQCLDKLEVASEDEKVGIAIIRKALEEPLRRIVTNAGMEATEVIQQVKTGEADFGFNAKTERYENLLVSGIIDPAKVTRLALEYAVSVAAMILTTECVIAKNPEKEEEVPIPVLPHMV